MPVTLKEYRSRWAGLQQADLQQAGSTPSRHNASVSKQEHNLHYLAVALLINCCLIISILFFISSLIHKHVLIANKNLLQLKWLYYATKMFFEEKKTVTF